MSAMSDANNLSLEETIALRWPSPPSWRFKSIPPEALCVCSVELLSGEAINGLLVEFEPATGAIHLWPDEHGSPSTIATADIRCLRLSAPARFERDRRGAHPQPGFTSARPLRLVFRDGKTLEASTLGVVKETSGVFVYLTEQGRDDFVNCFIPAAAIKTLSFEMPTKEGMPPAVPQAASAPPNKAAPAVKPKMGTAEDYLEQHAIDNPEALLAALALRAKPTSGRLGDILIEAGAITPAALEQALLLQSQQPTRRLGDILIELGIASMRLIQMALSRKFGIPYVNVATFPIEQGTVEVIETAFAIRHQVLPLIHTSAAIVVAVENPFAAEYLQDLRFQVGMTVDTVIADPKNLKERIAKEYAALEARPLAARGREDGAQRGDGFGAETGLKVHVTDLTSQLAREMKANSPTVREAISIDSRVSENTLVRLVNKIIIEAHAEGASDIHIENNAGLSPTRIRFRKDGELEEYLSLPHTYSHSLISRIKIMADLDISERRHPQDGKIDFSKHGPLAIELRVAIIPTANNLEDVVLRILASADAVPLSQLGFSAPDFKALKSMITRNYGFILVCGPTGSGKTTTLHSLLREVNQPDVKIWTAEDPVEITQPGLRQVQVNKKIDWTFAAAMRAFLRADPDVIMVGEMRDVETCKIAIEASLTGHLVFSTLHTNSAAETVVRLLDMGMDPFNFADALIGVISQRLVRKLCVHCRTSRVTTPNETLELLDEYCADGDLERDEVLQYWREHLFTDGSLILHEAAGCQECKDGYKGRMVTYEMLQASAAQKHLVRTRAPVPELFTTALKEGMVSLRQHALLLALKGSIDLLSARAVANSN